MPSEFMRTLFRKIVDLLLPENLIKTSPAFQAIPQPMRGIFLGKAGWRAFSGLQGLGVSFESAFVVCPTVSVPSHHDRGVQCFSGDHPLPGENSFKAAPALELFIQKLPSHQPLLVFISGGTSAMLSKPLSPLTDSEKRAVHTILIQSGRSISEINTIRRHLSAIKGGGLLRQCLRKNIDTVVLALSDVAGDAPWDIGSGPFSPDPTTFETAWNIARGIPDFSEKALSILEAGMKGEPAETLKPWEVPGEKNRCEILAGQNTGIAVAVQLLRTSGYSARAFPLRLSGAFDVWKNDFMRILNTTPEFRKTWLVMSGEIEVSKPSHATGRGGRAAHALLQIAGLLWAQGESFQIAAFATDGQDGNSGNAGGFLSSNDLFPEKISALNAALSTFDSARFLEESGRSLPGKITGTNISDLLMVRIE